MPIPGDNGKPREERDKQNERITKESIRGGLVVKELRLNELAPKEDCIFGKI